MNIWISQSFVTHVVLFMCLCMNLLHIKASPLMVSTRAIVSNETDRLALLDIKAQITSDPTQATSSWNDSLHFCQWQGVSCSKRHHRVTAVDLRSLQLVGSISPAIGNLSFIRTIRLSNNSFRGKIPPTIGRLYRLQVLSFKSNQLSGQIPANLSLCTNLRILSLTANTFTGRIPSSFGNLSFLQELYAVDNMFKGSIPDTLGQIKSLTFLSLGLNNLSGTIPPSIYNLSMLTKLYLQLNQLQGDLPPSIGQTLPNIHELVLYANLFTGVIPVSLSNATKLELLDLSGNQISGGVHIHFSNLQKLSWLGLSGTLLGSGESGDLNFISSLTNCSVLERLYLEGNNFGGVLPSSMANLSRQLKRFVVSFNHLSGSIPAGIGNLVNLETIDMESNEFTGSLPTSIGQLHELHEVGFGKNRLSGDIPSSIGNLTLLNQLWLEENHFEGSIPSSFGNCQSLFNLHLYGNNLSGTIPPELIGLSTLAISLSLARNQLTGSLPTEVGNLKNLGVLDISYNKLTGKIPKSLGSCQSLESVYLDHNSFEGAIPESLGSLKGSEEINLSHNNLSHEIPRSLSTILSLRKLDLSFNDLEGEVPSKGVFANVTAISVDGNRKLCGGVATLRLPACSFNKPRKHKKSLKLILLVPLVCAVLGVFFFLIFYCLATKRRSHKPLACPSTEPFPTVSYGQLLKATDGFSEANVIGSGSFGSVYKAKLNPNETTVAVKVLNLQNRGASNSFMSECEALKNIRHRNLVKILTACSSIDYHGNDFKALVYEFMPNGSLDTWLYPVGQAGHVAEEEPKNLNLLQRLNIAIDVASALDYLHNQCGIPIIHRDLKPSNILLDGELTAYVSDFGLAKLLKRDDSKSNENQTNSTGIKGTFGYADPEYGMGSIVSASGDVYSYGILLLEMFVGKRPTDDIFKDDLNLHKYAEMALPDRVIQFVDQTLLLGLEEEEATTRTRARMEKMNKVLTSIFRIGVACSQKAPRDRMKISQVVVQLKMIRDVNF